MGLFGKKKEEKKHMNEFQEDISKLLSRDDLRSRSDVAKVEYEKALNIVNNASSQEEIIRAYNLMGPLAVEFEYVLAMMWMGDFAESLKRNMQEAGYWFKKAAEKGDPNGARNYADLIMSGQIGGSQTEALSYYAFAADNGIAEAAFVMGELMRNSGNNERALEYYKKALDGGYTLAEIRISQLNKN